MKKRKIKPLEISLLDLIKETPEQRKQRVRESGNSYCTRVVENKKKNIIAKNIKRGNNYDSCKSN